MEFALYQSTYSSICIGHREVKKLLEIEKKHCEFNLQKNVKCHLYIGQVDYSFRGCHFRYKSNIPIIIMTN